MTPQEDSNEREASPKPLAKLNSHPLDGSADENRLSPSQSIRRRRTSAQPVLLNALRIITYDEFSHFIRKFVEGLIRFLLIVGGPGIAKSQTISRAVGNRAHLYLHTHASAFGLYHELYKHRGLPVIIDDLDHIYRDPASVRLLKCLCNTDATKRLRWPSRHVDIVTGQVPDSFTTTSPVCLIANEWRTPDANVQAIEDRAIILYFTPGAEEIHARAREWFADSEVYDFIEAHLRHIQRHSMRYYVKGSELRQIIPDKWKERLLELMGLDEKTRTIRHFIASPAYANDSERIAAFEAAGFGSRATFYRWKKDLGLT